MDLPRRAGRGAGLPAPLGAHEGEGTDLDVFGERVATAGTDGTIVLWSVEGLLARERSGS